jgi:hypothetical protein
MPWFPRALLVAVALVGCRGAGDQPGPGVRNAHVLFYDANREAVILFGGADEQAVRHDTWAWNGTTWRHLSDEGPSPRTFPAWAYDLEGKAAYLFGGNRVLFGKDDDANTFLADLWKWDGSAWRQQQMEGHAPIARAEAALAFDQRRRRLVLFGGRRTTDDGTTIRLGDTWEWDGRTWLLADSAGPTPRSGIAMVYDAERAVTVLFGGSTGTASGETWEWDGSRWTQSPAMVGPRFNPAMTYDPTRRRTVRFGGWRNPRRFGDTWTYDGARWDSVNVSGPPPRNHAALAYDHRRARTVLFGGHDGARVFGDVWEWDGDRWVAASALEPRLRIENGH